MRKITVWTKQNETVADILEKEGRYTAKRQFVERYADDFDNIVVQCYDWLSKNLPQKDRPQDADYPVWVTDEKDAVMMKTPGSVILELEIDEDILTKIDIEKWTAILNYSYIPLNALDRARHIDELKQYGTNDIDAFRTPFYPKIKREIEKSWLRLFDDGVSISEKGGYYGNIWEIKREWTKKIIR